MNPTGPDNTNPVRPRSAHRWRYPGALVATALLAGGLGAGVATAVTQGSAPPPTHKITASPLQGQAVSANAAQIAARVDPAVVNINTALDPLEGGGSAAGTGMIASPDGEIITNNHVVQGADTVTVTVAGHGRIPAHVIGTDPAADIAVLKINGLSELPTVAFGDSSHLTVGTSVVAIGNALGLGGNPTVTTGIISALGRTITATDQTGSNPETLRGLIQTDAPIAPGNSGGPLVDARGKVIGMDTAAASSGTAGASLGFAIPSDTVKAIASEITRHQPLPGLVYGRAPFLGIEVVDSSQIGSGVNPYGPFGNPFGFGFGFGPIANTPGGTQGVVVSAVDPASPAESAGIQPGDVITQVDGKATTSTTSLSKAIDEHKPGQAVTLTISTAAGAQTVTVKLAAGPID